MVLYTTEDLNFSNLFRVAVTAAAAIVVSANALAFVADIFLYLAYSIKSGIKIDALLPVYFMSFPFLWQFTFYQKTEWTKNVRESKKTQKKNNFSISTQSMYL